ncbi:MAG: YceI family protein [Dermatophilaceae bacterium]
MSSPAATQPPARDARTRAGGWAVVTDASRATFTVRDKLLATVRGTLPVTGGDVVIGRDGLVERAAVELGVAGISTGNQRRDTDLRKPGFLDAATHPQVRVQAQRAEPTAAGWVVDALLSARGRTAPVRLDVTRVVDADDEVHLHVTGRLDRSPLGIKAPTVIVGRFLDLDVTLVCRRAPDRS